MRIFSNFKDYYDIGLQYHDPTVVYERYTEEVEESAKFPEALKDTVRYSWKGEVLSKNVHVYAVCGEVFYVISYNESSRLYSCSTPMRNIIHRDLESFLAHINDLLKWGFGRRGKERTAIADFEKKLFELQFKYSSPIIHADACSAKIEINARLAEVDLQKEVDPFQMYQNIETFISNNLAQELNPPVKIEDKYKIPAHGFDKQSFRKRKSGE